VSGRFGEDASMIQNVVIHVSNEQPLLADLYSLPTASDAGLVCTNLRSTDGKRPIFVDNSESVFFFPYLVVRFVEIPPASMKRHMAEGGGAMPAGSAAPWSPMASRDDGDDRYAMDDNGTGRMPVPLPAGDTEIASDEPDIELEIDEDFLRRIREV
jgi:hypothetical protein